MERHSSGKGDLKPTGASAGFLSLLQAGHCGALEVLHGQQPALCAMEACSLFPGVREKASGAGYSCECFPKSGRDGHVASQARINSH